MPKIQDIGIHRSAMAEEDAAAGRRKKLLESIKKRKEAAKKKQAIESGIGNVHISKERRFEHSTPGVASSEVNLANYDVNNDGILDHEEKERLLKDRFNRIRTKIGSKIPEPEELSKDDEISADEKASVNVRLR
jgi:hypothetical protein